MPSGDPYKPELLAEIEESNLKAVMQCIEVIFPGWLETYALVAICCCGAAHTFCKTHPLHPLCIAADAWQDCITIRKGPYEPKQAEIIKADVEAGREPVRDALKRFFHEGQLVRIEGIEGPLSYRNERVGLIVHTQQDEMGRFCVVLNDFDGECKGNLEQTWIRLPPTHLRVQVGMVPGLFMDWKFENAAIKAGKLKIPKRRQKKATAPIDISNSDV